MSQDICITIHFNLRLSYCGEITPDRCGKVKNLIKVDVRRKSSRWQIEVDSIID